MKNFNRLLMSGVLLLCTSQVMALPMVTGTMEMTGGFYAVDAQGSQVGAADATGVDFNFFGFDMFRVTRADGDFTGLAGSIGDITDFQFDPFVGPIDDFWAVGGFSYDLLNVTRGPTNDPANFLVLQGEGIISATGFADTAASWSFSGDTSGSGIFSWSATSAAVADVPEPSLLALLAVGLTGFAINGFGRVKTLKR